MDTKVAIHAYKRLHRSLRKVRSVMLMSQQGMVVTSSQ